MNKEKRVPRLRIWALFEKEREPLKDVFPDAKVEGQPKKP